MTGYPPREWLLFLGMAVGPGVFGHTVINWALAHLESSVVSVSLLGEPVGSALLALLLLAEILVRRPSPAVPSCSSVSALALEPVGRSAPAD